jgi:hypothetical protein
VSISFAARDLREALAKQGVTVTAEQAQACIDLTNPPMTAAELNFRLFDYDQRLDELQAVRRRVAEELERLAEKATGCESCGAVRYENGEWASASARCDGSGVCRR